jgi:hypothetical protein
MLVLMAIGWWSCKGETEWPLERREGEGFRWTGTFCCGGALMLAKVVDGLVWRGEKAASSCMLAMSGDAWRERVEGRQSTGLRMRAES